MLLAVWGVLVSSRLWGDHEWQRVHWGSCVSVQGFKLFLSGGIVGQELFRHVACADR